MEDEDESACGCGGGWGPRGVGWDWFLWVGSSAFMKDAMSRVGRPLLIHHVSETIKYVRRRRACEVGLRWVAIIGKKSAEVTRCIL